MCMHVYYGSDDRSPTNCTWPKRPNLSVVTSTLRRKSVPRESHGRAGAMPKKRNDVRMPLCDYVRDRIQTRSPPAHLIWLHSPLS